MLIKTENISYKSKKHVFFFVKLCYYLYSEVLYMINEIKSNLVASFNSNSDFDANNIGKDNTVEDKIFGYLIKMSSIFKIDFSNFYNQMKTFKLKPLSVFENKGFDDYDPKENIGYINPYVLNKDPNNEFNIDQIFTKIMLKTTTAKGNFYGFGNDSKLHALNEACTSMIAQNLSGSPAKSLLEEEMLALNMINVMLKNKPNSKIDFITAYFTNNGALLKQELNNMGIDDDILNQLNYMQQAKLSDINIPDLFAKIANKINKVFATLVSNKVITDKEVIDKYQSNLVNNQVLDYSHVKLDEISNNMKEAIKYLENNLGINYGSKQNNLNASNSTNGSMTRSYTPTV